MPATDFLTPPQWLQGDWEGNDYRVSASEGNISYGPIGTTAANLFDQASQTGAVLLVRENTASDFRFDLITFDEAGHEQLVDYHFGIFDTNRITFNSNHLKVTAVMLRQ